MENFILNSIIASVVLTAAINLFPMLFPKATKKIEEKVQNEITSSIEKREGQQSPKIKIFFPWKFMLFASVILTVLVNLIGFLSS